MLFLFLIIPLLYLAIGANYSRNRYATIMASAKQTIEDLKAINIAKDRVSAFNAEIAAAQSRDLSTLLKYHKSGCDKVRYTAIGICDCGFLKERKKSLQDSLNFLEGKVDEPNVIAPMLAWPGYGVVTYLKSGTVKPSKAYNPDYTRILEEQLEIAELP